MSAASTSDSDDQYSNFKKYKKKHQVKKRKALPPTTSPKKFESQFKSMLTEKRNVSSDEDSDKEIPIEQILAEQKKKAALKKSVEIEILDELTPDDEEVNVAGPAERTRSRSNKGKKKTTTAPAPRTNRADAILAEIQRAEWDQQQEHLATLQTINSIANNLNTSETNDREQVVTISLKIVKENDFHEVFKHPYGARFDTVYLDYGSKAGFDRPEDFVLVWEADDVFVPIKFFDSPEKIGMPLRGKVEILISPKEGAKRDKRQEGEIKIKLNMKSERVPLERLIHKEMTFGAFKDKFCKELNLKPNKVRFNFDGDRVADDDTPTSLDIEEFEVIDVVVDP